MGDDRRHMMRALELAGRAAGMTSPNPMVGCVVVKDGDVIGEGWHKKAGAPHAEIEALAEAGEAARGACVYVTLEPCAHHGLTGPCADALIAAGVAEIVYAVADPNREAAGGAERLAEAGIKVRNGVCETEAREQNRFWLHAVETARPYVIAKFAASLDGRIATRTGESKWITGPEARARAHDLRRQVDAILVGVGTVIADDPSLTARSGEETVARPLRVILDSTAQTPPGAAALERSGSGALIATTTHAPAANLEACRAVGADLLTLETDEAGRPDAAALLPALYARSVRAVMVEGGAGVLGAFFDAGLVDEVWAFIAPIVIGGGRPAVAGAGPLALADALRLENVETETLGADFLIRGRAGNRKEAR